MGNEPTLRYSLIPRDVETNESYRQPDPRNLDELYQTITTKLRDQSGRKLEPNVYDNELVDVNPFGGGKPRYVNHLYQPRHNDHAVDRDDRDRDDPIRSLGLKTEIPEFTGKVHPDDFIDWLSTGERRQIKVKSKVETWEKIKKLMKAKFLPENHLQEAFLDYHNLSQ
ncbi:hypothetical protein Tco_0267032 [Tanacetum coccineum]